MPKRIVGVDHVRAVDDDRRSARPGRAGGRSRGDEDGYKKILHKKFLRESQSRNPRTENGIDFPALSSHQNLFLCCSLSVVISEHMERERITYP